MALGITEFQDYDKLKSAVLALRDEAVTARRKVEQDREWDRCEQYYRARIYESLPMPEWRAKGSPAKAFEAVERYTAVITDSTPTFGADPVGPEDTALVDHATVAGTHEWDAQKMALRSESLLRDSLILGTGFLMPGVRQDAAPGRDLFTQVPSPKNVFPDPQATNDDDLSHVFVRDFLTVSQLAEAFPADVTEITKEVQPSSKADPAKANSGSSDPVGEFTITSAVGGGVAGFVGRSRLSTLPAGRRYEVWQGYFRSGLEIDAEVQLADGSTAVVPTAVFPNGVIVTVVEQEIVDVVENTARHRKIGPIRMPCYNLPGQYFGLGIVQPILDNVWSMAFLRNKVMDHVSLCCNQETVVDSYAEVDVENDFPYPGKIVVVRDKDSRYEKVAPPGLPAYLWQLYQTIAREVDDTTGISDISRGNLSPDQDWSGRAINAAQAPSFTRIRPVVRRYEEAISEWCYRTFCNMAQYRPSSWWARILPPGTAVIGFEDWEDDDWATMPDIRMHAGSSLPQDKDALFNKGVLLSQNGAFGPPGSPMAAEELLFAAGWPHREQVVADLEHVAANQAPPAPGEASPPQAAQPGPNKGLGQEAGPEEAFAPGGA